MLIDMQERLLGNAVWVVRIAQRLSVPVTITEQYPKGLGAAVRGAA